MLPLGPHLAELFMAACCVDAKHGVYEVLQDSTQMYMLQGPLLTPEWLYCLELTTSQADPTHTVTHSNWIASIIPANCTRGDVFYCWISCFPEHLVANACARDTAHVCTVAYRSMLSQLYMLLTLTSGATSSYCSNIIVHKTHSVMLSTHRCWVKQQQDG